MPFAELNNTFLIQTQRLYSSLHKMCYYWLLFKAFNFKFINQFWFLEEYSPIQTRRESTEC